MKYLKFTFLALFFILINTVPVYANDILPNFEDYIKQDDGTELYYIVQCYNSHYATNSSDVVYTLYIYDEPLNPYTKNGNYYYETSVGNQDGDMLTHIYTFSPGDSNWSHKGSGYRLDTIKFGFPPDQYDHGTTHDYILMYSNYDITYNNQPFFQQAPMISGAIVPRMEIMGYCLKLARSYLPSLIALLICVIAFWKSWKWLKMQLSR